MKSGIIVCSRRSKRKKEDLPHLPREIIFNILSGLPAEFLHNEVKYVCKTWANIIRDPAFVQTHLLHSNPGLLIQSTVKNGNIRYLEAKEGKIKVTPEKKSQIPVMEDILASCDGILLSILGGVLCVTNCVTKQVLKLPRLCSKTCNKVHNLMYEGSIAHIPHTRDLKVILPCLGLDGCGHWHVLTVGTDGSWRKIDSGIKEINFTFFMIRPISIHGVIYWANHRLLSKTFIAVDLRDESFHLWKVPDEFLLEDSVCWLRASAYGFQKMNNYLSCIVRDANQMEIHVWILKNLHSSEWSKSCKIEYKDGLKIPIWDHWYYIPAVWLDNGRILVFIDKSGGRMGFIAYNLSTGAMRIIKNVSYDNYKYVLDHTKSLVSW